LLPHNLIHKLMLLRSNTITVSIISQLQFLTQFRELLYQQGKKTPTTVLNPDGSGVIQYDDLTKKKINWGIECSDEGIPIFKEGFNSASYTFWYRPTDSNEWIYSQFSIHFTKKKMFLMGERMKEYVDFNVQ
jgi:hypothetical protein